MAGRHRAQLHGWARQRVVQRRRRTRAPPTRATRPAACSTARWWTFPSTPDLRFTLLAENNAWDFNVGAAAVVSRHPRRRVRHRARRRLEPPRIGDGATSQGFHNYRKVAFTLGWQSNMLALLHGDFLQKRAERLARERERAARGHHRATTARRGAAARARPVRGTESSRARAAPRRRRVQLRQEREALRRLEDRLKRVEQQRGTSRHAQP